MADRMQFRRDTAANWTAYNPILLEGELGFELDTDQYKLGDGIHNWNALPYRGLPCVQQRGTSVTTPMSQKAVTDELNLIGVFDISAHNLTDGQPTKYADLTAALGTNGANVPTQYRVPGMTVRYIQSSDSKYVQFRLMSDVFNTNTVNWQGIDKIPKNESLNLVESAGVERALERLSYILYRNYVVEYYGKYVSNYNTGGVNNATENANGVLFSVEAGKQYKTNIQGGSFLYGTVNSFQFYDEGGVIGGVNLGHGTVVSSSGVHTAPANAKYLLISVNPATINDITSIYLEEAGNQYSAILEAISNIVNAGYLYAGIAETTTNPGTPTNKVFYVAINAGTYTNFGGAQITSMGLNILKYDGSAWSLETIIKIDRQIKPSIEDIPTVGAVNECVSELAYLLYRNYAKGYYGYRVDNYNTGHLSVATESINSVLFDVEPNAKYMTNIPIGYTTHGAVNSFQFYDESGLSSLSNLGHGTLADGVYTAPANARYLVITLNTANITSVTDYYLKKIPNVYDGLDSRISVMETNFSKMDLKDVEDEISPVYFTNVNLIGTNGVPFKLGTYTWGVCCYKVTPGLRYKIKGLWPAHLPVSGSYITYSLASNVTFVDNVPSVSENDIVEVGITNNQFVNTYSEEYEIVIPSNVNYLIASVWHGYLLKLVADAEEAKNIYCFGDSLTAQGWPGMLQQIINQDKYKVYNRGIGGQDSATILGRQGGSPFYLVSDVTLPADTSEVTLPIETIDSQQSLGIATKTNDYVSYTNKLLCQGDYFNNVLIDGIECILGKTGTTTATSYTLKRKTASDGQTVLKAGSILYGSQFKDMPNVSICVVFIGQNGGYDSPETLVKQVQKAVQFTGCGEKYIAISSHGNGYLQIQNAFIDAFGAKALNLQWYFPNYGISDAIRFGLATEEEMAGHTWDDGTLKPSDNVHLTTLGYEVLAYKVREMMLSLGYIEAQE